MPLLGAIPEDTDVIVSTNRGEPLVLRKKLTLSGIAFENTARRLVRAHPSRPPPHTHTQSRNATDGIVRRIKMLAPSSSSLPLHRLPTQLQVGKSDYLIDLDTPYKSVFQRVSDFFVGE